MSSPRSIWSAAPQSVRQGHSTVSHLVNKEQQCLTALTAQQQQQKGVVPAGHKCRHGKWQPEPAETAEAKKYTCYECTFICSKCGENSAGLCDSYECS